ncbi:hypothetical protein Bbelb_083370 [Branchiostoma belcheri]|nr:hypothetical protein Bbelb_083370 [Branchiostoma belcheri]
MAEGPDSDVTPGGTTAGLSEDDMRPPGPPTETLKTARQVDSGEDNGGDADDDQGAGWVCPAVTAAVVLMLLILVGTLIGLYLNTSQQDSQEASCAYTVQESSLQPTQPVDTALSTGQPNLDSTFTTDHPACCSSVKTAMVDLLLNQTDRSVNGQTASTVPSTSTTQQSDSLPSTFSTLKAERNGKSKPIVFGGQGKSPGQMQDPNGVAVSADNEILVADMVNKRVQVFSMNGVFLRLFPTEVPGGDGRAMYPTDVDIDGEGRIWVVGKDRVTSGAVTVVQYGTNGLPLTTFDVKRLTWYPNIAVNERYNKIIVVAGNELFKFKPNGSLDGSFGKKEGNRLQYVTSDRDGNILVTVSSLPGVLVYDHNGQRLFSFRTAVTGVAGGICMDPQGHLMVADWANGRVDMFTSRGEFVRMVVNVTKPRGIALGPGGQLVVIDSSDYIVRIFPRWMVYPDE